MRDLAESLRHQFHFSTAPASEFTLAVAPQAVEPRQLAALGEAGFNRLLLLEPTVDTKLVSLARQGGFRSVGVVLTELQAALSCAGGPRPDRIGFQSRVEDTPSRSQPTAILRECMEQAGYTHLGLDQFALPDDELALAFRKGCLQYGLFGFTTHAGCDLLSFGAGAISQVADCFSRNSESPDAWRGALDKGRLPAQCGLRLSRDDEIRSELIQQLLCRRQVDIEEIEREFGILFRSYFARELTQLRPCVGAGMVRDAGDRIEVCSRGWPWLRNIALCFDAYAGAGRRRQETQARH